MTKKTQTQIHLIKFNQCERTTEHRASKPKLPSNWGRYDDNVEGLELGHGLLFDSAYGETGGLKKAVDGVGAGIGVLPKSKGADFRELIAQAKDSTQYYSPSFPHNLDDFYQGLVPMLEGRSEGIPSWDRDDDFLLENEAATSDEAPNFSLNLKALAEDLAKENLAKRLFIEPDLFPPELSGPDADVADSQVPEKRLTTFETFEELYSIYLADEKIAETEEANEDGTMSSLDDRRDFKTKDMPQPSQVTEQDTESKLDDAEREISHVTDQDSMLKFKNLAVRDAREPPIADDAGKQDTRPSSQFVADVAEAELDTLLNSFSDTKLSKSSATSINQEGTFMSFSKGNPVTHKAPLPHSPDAFSPPTKITSSLDDDLDDLLDAANLDKKGGLFQSIEVKTETTENECFLGLSRSVYPVSSCSLDDELDNLLEETSKSTEVKIGSSDFSSSSSSMSLHPSSKPKVLDDFDTWLDTL